MSAKTPSSSTASSSFNVVEVHDRLANNVVTYYNSYTKYIIGLTFWIGVHPSIFVFIFAFIIKLFIGVR
jgi:hypothetical protein